LQLSERLAKLMKWRQKTEDGKGLVAEYLEGDLKREEDFILEEEIDLLQLQ
jgi:hypothetical protein